ncbi:endonuclease/exonuclease/phosphatase family protein [archaeon]|nr:endonuclease/exonuclease/phosphatase family protein [archaeon]
MKIRFLQWNILYTEKIENVMKFVRKVNPDIMCIQEATVNGKWNSYTDTAKWLSRKLEYYYFFLPTSKFPEGNLTGNAILSRYPIQIKKHIKIKKR